MGQRYLGQALKSDISFFDVLFMIFTHFDTLYFSTKFVCVSSVEIFGEHRRANLKLKSSGRTLKGKQ